MNNHAPMPNMQRLTWKGIALQVAHTLKPRMTMVITDFAVGPETRIGPDFTIIVEDRETKGQRK